MKCTNYKVLSSLFFVSISTLSLAKVDADGNNELMRSARQGDREKVRALLLVKYNGSILNKQNNNGNTALMLAVMSRSVPTVQELLMYNVVDLNIKNKDGKTALDLALELSRHNKEDDMVRLLVKHKPRGIRVKNGGERKGSSPRNPYNYTF